jgi:prepilin-type N-terminal cleavage/methylation domain-containing protein/prepilin-type processing-associated H-X9-DG protein
MLEITGRCGRGFSLVELLVVIGIIALLIALLLPSLAGARRSANTVACAANLRSIVQGMQIYAAEHKGYYPGGMTSGRHLFRETLTKPESGGASDNDPRFNDDHCPGISQNWDWMAPTAQALGISFNDGADAASRAERFNQLRSHPTFVCPENRDVIVPSNPSLGGPDVGAGVQPSYAITTSFHLLPWGTGGRVGRTQAGNYLSPPQGFGPQLAKVRNASRKIYVADAARYSRPQDAPSVSLTHVASGGGAFGDVGAFAATSNAWNRQRAPGNTGGSGTLDCRIYAFRHGRRTQKGPADAYKLNAAFFDGHVELLGDLEASNPDYWIPSGTWYDPNAPGGFPMNDDAAAKYGGNTPRMIP